MTWCFLTDEAQRFEDWAASVGIQLVGTAISSYQSIPYLRSLNKPYGIQHFQDQALLAQDQLLELESSLIAAPDT